MDTFTAKQRNDTRAATCKKPTVWTHAQRKTNQSIETCETTTENNGHTYSKK